MDMQMLRNHLSSKGHQEKCLTQATNTEEYTPPKDPSQFAEWEKLAGPFSIVEKDGVKHYFKKTVVIENHCRYRNQLKRYT